MRQYWVKSSADAEADGPIDAKELRRRVWTGELSRDGLVSVDNSVFHRAERMKYLKFPDDVETSAGDVATATAAAPVARPFRRPPVIRAVPTYPSPLQTPPPVSTAPPSQNPPPLANDAPTALELPQQATQELSDAPMEASDATPLEQITITSTAEIASAVAEISSISHASPPVEIPPLPLTPPPPVADALADSLADTPFAHEEQQAPAPIAETIATPPPLDDLPAFADDEIALEPVGDGATPSLVAAPVTEPPPLLRAFRTAPGSAPMLSPAVTARPAAPFHTPAMQSMQPEQIRLRPRGMFTFWLLASLLFVASAAITFGLAQSLRRSHVRIDTYDLIAMIGGVCFFAIAMTMLVLWIIWMSRVHKDVYRLSHGHYPISGEKAIGLWFIPIFNWYWSVHAPLRLCREVNQHLTARALPLISCGTVRTCQILSILLAIPLPGAIALLNAFSMSQIQRGLNRLANH